MAHWVIFQCAILCISRLCGHAIRWHHTDGTLYDAHHMHCEGTDELTCRFDSQSHLTRCGGVPAIDANGGGVAHDALDEGRIVGGDELYGDAKLFGGFQGIGELMTHIGDSSPHVDVLLRYALYYQRQGYLVKYHSTPRNQSTATHQTTLCRKRESEQLMSVPVPTDLMWIQDAAREFDVSVEWLRKQKKAGKLQSYEIPPDTRDYVSRAEVQGLMAPRPRQ